MSGRPIRTVLLVEDNQLGGAPGLAGFAQVTPEFELWNSEIAAANVVIARRLRLDVCRRGIPRLLDSLRHGASATCEKEGREKNVGGAS